MAIDMCHICGAKAKGQKYQFYSATPLLKSELSDAKDVYSITSYMTSGRTQSIFTDYYSSIKCHRVFICTRCHAKEFLVHRHNADKSLSRYILNSIGGSMCFLGVSLGLGILGYYFQDIGMYFGWNGTWIIWSGRILMGIGLILSYFTILGIRTEFSTWSELGRKMAVEVERKQDSLLRHVDFIEPKKMSKSAVERLKRDKLQKG